MRAHGCHLARGQEIGRAVDLEAVQDDPTGGDDLELVIRVDLHIGAAVIAAELDGMALDRAQGIGYALDPRQDEAIREVVHPKLLLLLDPARLPPRVDATRGEYEKAFIALLGIEGQREAATAREDDRAIHAERDLHGGLR